MTNIENKFPLNNQEQNNKKNYYLVVSGDQMGTIAQKHNMSLDELIAYNTKIGKVKTRKEWDKIQIKEKIWIPEEKMPHLKNTEEKEKILKSTHQEKKNLKEELPSVEEILKESSKTQMDTLLEFVGENDEEKAVIQKIHSLIEKVKSNLDTYTIQSGDTPRSIANKHSTDLESLLNVNNIFGLMNKKKGYTIYPNKPLYIPNKEAIETITELEHLIPKLDIIKKINSKNFDAHNKVFEKITHDLYPQKQAPIGFIKAIDAFIKSQKENYDPELPRIVDISREEFVGCSNMLRTLMYFTTKGQGTKEEQLTKTEQNIDAWEFPSALQNIGFKQDFSELMSHFDISTFKSRNPIENKEAYNELVIELADYLNKNPEKLKGSLVPFYFNLSKYKGMSYRYNENKPENERHLNTHVSFFGGEGQMIFKANKVDIIKNGENIDFGITIKKIEKKIETLENEKKKIETLNKNIGGNNYEHNLLNKKFNDNVVRIANLNKEIIEEKAKLQNLKNDIDQAKIDIQNIENKNAQLHTHLLEVNSSISTSRTYMKNISSNTQLALGEFSYLNRKYNLIHVVVKKYGFFNNNGVLIDGIEDELISMIESSGSADELSKKLQSLSNENNKYSSKILKKLGDNYSTDQQFHKDIVFFFNMIKNRHDIESGLSLLNTFLTKNENQPIQITDLPYLLTQDKDIQNFVSNYNKHLNLKGDLEKDIGKNNSEKNKKGLIIETYGREEDISVIDFIANFIQSRQDFSASYSNVQKEEIIKGLATFAGIIQIKVNGTSVNLAEEYNKYISKDQKSLTINSEDEIELIGPMMIDGEHQYNSNDIDKQKNLNTRTRFFFEFITGGNYLPTEILIPDEKSIFKSKSFNTFADKLEIENLYDLKFGGRLYDKLKDIIIKKENLDPSSPNFESQFAKFYSLQIKALKVFGYLQSENKINDGALHVNASIPYINPDNINKIYAEYNKYRKQEGIRMNETDAQYNNYIEVKVYSGDVKNNIFSQLKSLVEAHKDKKSYPHLKYIKDFNKLSIELFMNKIMQDRFFTDSMSEKRTWDNIREGDTMIVPLNILDSIISEVEVAGEIEKRDIAYNKYAELISKDQLQNKFPLSLVNLLPSLMFSETGYDKDVFIAKRARAKNILSPLGFTSSRGPYQLKFSWIENVWLNDLVADLFTIDKSKLDNNEKELLEDIKNIYVQGDMAKLRNLIEDTIDNVNIDDKSGNIYNYISNFIILKKLKSNEQNLSYKLFQQIGHNPSKIPVDEYNAGLFIVNNLGEDKANNVMFDNFIKRFVIAMGQGSLIGKENELGNSVGITEIFDFGIKSYFGSKVEYHSNDFVRNLTKYISLLEKYLDKDIINELNNIVEKKSFKTTEWEKLVQKLQKIYEEKGINSSFLPSKDEVKENLIFNAGRKYYENQVASLENKEIIF